MATTQPDALFAFRPAGSITVPSNAVAQNGQRFRLNAIVETDAKAPLSVVQHWTEAIKRWRTFTTDTPAVSSRPSLRFLAVPSGIVPPTTPVDRARTARMRQNVTRFFRAFRQIGRELERSRGTSHSPIG